MTDNAKDNTTDKHGHSNRHTSHYAQWLRSGFPHTDGSQEKDGKTHHTHHRSKYKYMPLCGWMRATHLLVWALAASLLSTLIFVLCSVRGGIGNYLGLPVQQLYVVAHLFGCFGNTILLWSILSIRLRYEKKVTFDTYFNCISFYAVYATAIYHIACAISYAFVEVKVLYMFAVSMWWIRAFLGLHVVLVLFKYGDTLYRVTAVALLIYYIAGAPYVLPTYLAMVQWIAAKLSAVGMAVLLYYCGRSKYSDSK